MTFPASQRGLLSGLSRLRRDDGGNVAIIFGIMAMPMLMTAGIVIDYGINANARQQAQNALDATTLTLAKLPASTTDDDLQARATTQITAAMAKSQANSFTVKTSRTGDTVTITLTGTSPTTLTNIMGFKSLPLSVTSIAKRGSSNLEIALVLDNTGSMAGTKMNNLKSAATDMINDLFDHADPSKPSSIKMSIVPFSQTVNVGPDNVSAAWLDTNGLASYHSQLFIQPANRLLLFKAMKVAWGGCVESRPNPYDVNDTPASTTTPDTLFVPYFAPDESDNDSNAQNDYMSDYPFLTLFQSNNNRVRQGQIQKYTANSSNTGLLAQILNPSSGSYSTSYGPNAGCDLQPITPLTNSRTTLTSAIAKMNATGETNIAMGGMWGWHTLSPNGPLVKGASYSDQSTRKYAVLMTDGENSSSKINDSNGSNYAGISYIWAKRIGNFNETTASATRNSALDDRLSLVCTNMKAAGIQIFTIRVEVTTGSSSLLQSCASTPGMFYDVQNSANLSAEFQAIAAQVSELRLSQ